MPADIGFISWIDYAEVNLLFLNYCIELKFSEVFFFGFDGYFVVATKLD